MCQNLLSTSQCLLQLRNLLRTKRHPLPRHLWQLFHRDNLRLDDSAPAPPALGAQDEGVQTGQKDIVAQLQEGEGVELHRQTVTAYVDGDAQREGRTVVEGGETLSQ